MLKRSLLTRLVLPLAVFKLALGLAAFFKTHGDPATRDPYFFYSFHTLFPLAFGLTAAVLLLGGRADRRAVALGGFFLVTATAWCNRPLGLAAGGQPGVSLFSLADALELDAFMAFFLWSFVHDFPNPPISLPARQRILVAVRASAVAALLLFGLNLLLFIVENAAGESGRAWRLLAPFAPLRGRGIYYGVVLALTAAAFPFLLWKARIAQRDDQRRARLFLFLLVFTFGPMVAEVLLEMFAPGYRPFTLAHPRLKRYTIIAVMLPALTLPFTVPYAVLVHQVLDVKLMARRALQYALARYSVLTLVTVPLAALCGYLYVNRDQSLTNLFTGERVLLVLAALAVGVAALRFRRPLLDAIDRRFFREQYDARRILTLLVDRIRSIQESTSLANLVSREIDLALHLEGIALMVLDPRSNMLADPRNRARKLDAASPLAQAISNASDPLEVDLEDPHSPLLKLPEKDRHWLVDSGFRLLVPILARDGALLGIVGLGEKKSGLPFLREDRQLLHAIASSAAWVLELEQEKSLPSSTPPHSWRDPLEIAEAAADSPSATPEHAKECSNCGLLHPSYTVFCSSCSRRLEKSRVPYVLPGKFRFERRIGVGGMGIVYQGADLALGRQVAIKTLRRVSPEDAMRLRREARTAAAVSHSHLAPIYGMETWQGTPMMILELLEGGTLAQRLYRNKLLPRETVELGIAMADALAQLHAADILHRDVKPSNIGYTRDGFPKLMDFGIARMMFELHEEEELEGMEEEDDGLVPPVAVWSAAGSDLVARHQFAGTLSYLSPEALRGDPADASFDLWGLTVVLYECLLGQKVFTGSNEQVAERIQAGRVPDFSQLCPEHPAVLGEFFRAALHRTRSRRPATARDLRRRLEEVRALL